MQESLRPVDARTMRNRSDWQIVVKRPRGEPHANSVPRIPVRCLSRGRSPNSCRLNSVPGAGRRVLNSGADDTGAAWSQYSKGGNFLWSKCQDLGKSSILFSHNIFCGVALSSLPTGNRPESAQFEQLRRYVVQIKARGPRPTLLTHCYHWICITPYGMCTLFKPHCI